MIKATKEARAILPETPKIKLYPSFAQSPSSDHGNHSESKEYPIKIAVLISPARTNPRAICLPYNSPITSVIRKTIGNENTATERCEPNKNGMIFKPRVFAANNEVKYNVSAIIILLFITLLLIANKKPPRKAANQPSRNSRRYRRIKTR